MPQPHIRLILILPQRRHRKDHRSPALQQRYCLPEGDPRGARIAGVVYQEPRLVLYISLAPSKNRISEISEGLFLTSFFLDLLRSFSEEAQRRRRGKFLVAGSTYGLGEAEADAWSCWFRGEV